MAEDMGTPQGSVSPPEVGLITIYPLKSFGRLRDRFGEDTADVFFVDQKTKEKVSAHRQVLSVASAVFFKMFNGDWREKEEKEIPAPEEYSWESFKAAITLLYGEEVEVEESSIPDIYRVAHCYDLKEVVYVLAQDIRQWDVGQVDIAVKLCTLIGELETEEEQSGNALLEAGMECIARNMVAVEVGDIARLPYQAMLMLVQSEELVLPEADLLSIVCEWVKGRPDVTVVQSRRLLDHIRFGTIPYEALVACEVGHKNLSIALRNHHQLSAEMVRSNVEQVSPRYWQDNVFQVFPVSPCQSVAKQGDKWHCSCTSSPSAVAVIYFSMHEVTFEGTIEMANAHLCSLVFELSAYGVTKQIKQAEVALQETTIKNNKRVAFTYQHFVVILNKTGAHLILQSTEALMAECLQGTQLSRTLHLPFKASFPWLLTFGVGGSKKGACSFTFTHPVFH